MKETLKKVFDKSVLLVVGVIFGCGIIFEYVVFPGLTAADSYLNILSALIGIFTILLVYRTIQWKDLIQFLSNKDEVVPPGETEYDYLPKEEVIKKKRNPKQSSKTKSEEPFVKTRKKPKSK
jgi:Na+(H+)/acetate symporter ActP